MTYGIGEPCVDVLERACVEECLPEELLPYRSDNEAFFAETLPGRNGPLGSPGGAARLGPLGVDTPLVAGLPQRAAAPGARSS